MQMSQTVAGTLVDVLEKIGVKHIFGLIGDSLNPLADAVRHSKIEWVGVRHEEGAALAAAGQAKLTGRLSVCCGTTGPGSTHLVAGLYEASRDHAPVLALSGDMPRKVQGTDYFKRQSPTCYSVMSRSIPRPFPRLPRRRPSSIRPSPPLMQAPASRI
jgi:pyruvate dehydrogenase (quinone)